MLSIVLDIFYKIKLREKMKSQIFHILIGAGLFIIIEGLKNIDSNGIPLKYGCHLDENHCIKIINKKKEWCYSNENGLDIKVPCKSNDDCINSIECVTYPEKSVNLLFIDQPSTSDVPPSVSGSPPSLEINVTIDSNQANKRPVSLLSHYSYDTESGVGPQNWYKAFRKCLSNINKNQSPIDIKTYEARRMEDWSPVMVIFPPTSTPFKDAVLENNGIALKLSILNDPPIKLKAAGLKNDYLLQEVYFHFGCEADRGSEHQIDGKKYSLEVQFVFWNNVEYNSFNDAKLSDTVKLPTGERKDIQNPVDNGLAIVAVLFDEDYNVDMKNFDVLNNAINEIGDKPKGKSVITENLGELLQGLLPEDIKIGHHDFFKYKGSLTMPPCSESVDWFVLADCCKLKVPNKFLQTLQKLRGNPSNRFAELCDNFRPIQKRNSRFRTDILW